LIAFDEFDDHHSEVAVATVATVIAVITVVAYRQLRDKDRFRLGRFNDRFAFL
jgi:hypothetical protein